jgi:uncharacterized membrane protein (GlpM family)
MTTDQKSGNGWTGVMRWTARILALVAGGLFVFAAIEFGPKILGSMSWTSAQGMPLLLGLLVALIGALIAWRWELVGGLMAVAGAVIVMALVCIGSGLDMLYCAILFTLPLLLAGALYLACCWRTRERASSRGA